jgi:hypothetical protein
LYSLHRAINLLFFEIGYFPLNNSINPSSGQDSLVNRGATAIVRRRLKQGSGQAGQTGLSEAAEDKNSLKKRRYCCKIVSNHLSGGSFAGAQYRACGTRDSSKYREYRPHLCRYRGKAASGGPFGFQN